MEDDNEREPDSFPVAEVTESNGEISASVEETNRIRKLLGLKPLKIKQKVGKDEGDGQDIKAAVTEENGEVSCSIEETNRIRAKLGLKPLRMTEKKPTVPKKSKKEIEREETSLALKQKIANARKQRKLNAKLAGKTLGDVTERDGENAADWLRKTKAIQDENLKKKDVKPAQDVPKRSYSAKELAGLKVSHDMSELSASGEQVILTLKDSKIINDETGDLEGDVDELENTRLAEHERTQNRLERLNKKSKKKRLDYQDEENGQGSVLGKYDKVLEEEGFVKKKRRVNKAVLGADGKVIDQQAVENEIAEKLSEKQQHQSINDSVMFQPAQDFYTTEEYESLDVKVKKKKKSKKEKKKSKKKSKKRSSKDASGDDSSEEIIGRKPSTKHRRALPVEDEINEDNNDLAAALASARRSANEKEEKKSIEKLAELAKLEREAAQGDDVEMQDKNALVISGTTGFSSIIETRMEEQSTELEEARQRKIKQQQNKQTSSTSSSSSSSSSSTSSARQGVFTKGEDDTPVASGSIGEALKLLGSRGDINKKKAKEGIIVGRARDDAPVQDDGEGGFVLEYRDDQGRLMSRKEAFRQLARTFYGQKDSYNKKAKRERDLERQKQAMGSSSNDTPLGLVEKMKKKQQQTGQAHVKL